MSIRNQNWYNLQASRQYPLADNATTTDDAGNRLPDDLLVDCVLRWPRELGQYAFLSAITVTPNLATAVFMATDDYDSPAASFVPLAAVTVAQPVTPHTHYAVQALTPGVGGFVVFEDLRETFIGRFSSPRQGLLCPKCAIPYRELPVTSLRKHNRVDGLVDLVRLLPGPDITMTREEMEIEGELREALVLRLAGNASRNLFKDYIGPCGARPESQNCNRDAVQSIAGVIPDCDGNINITFSGLINGTIDDCHTVIEHPAGIEDVCPARGEHHEGEDGCDTEDSSLSSDSTSNSSDSSAASESSVSSASETPCGFLPDNVTELFDDIDFPPDNWEIISGDWEFRGYDSVEEVTLPDQSFTATSLAVENIALLNYCSNSLGKTVRTQFKLSETGFTKNAGIIVNYREVDPLSPGNPTYYTVLADYDNAKFTIYRYSGGSQIMEAQATLLETLTLDEWYEIVVTITAFSPTLTLINATLTNIEDGTWTGASVGISTTRYLPDNGQFGITARLSEASFAFFESFPT